MMHVWHQGRKVTGLSGNSYGRHHYVRGRGYIYIPPITPEILKARLKKLGKMSAPATVADRSSYSSTVRIAEAWFRLLDVHGKPHGRRYTRVGPSDSDMFMVVDQHGNETWLDGAARVRVVDQQPEAVHSQASRIINQLHRQLKEGTQ